MGERARADLISEAQMSRRFPIRLLFDEFLVSMALFACSKWPQTMSYVIEQTESLLRVLDRAMPFAAHRLAGYAANAEFWAAQVRHCRELLDGYSERYQSMKRGTEDYLREHPDSPQRIDADTRTTRSTKDSEIREMRRRLDESAGRFFNRLRDANLLADERIAELVKVLGDQIIEK